VKGKLLLGAFVVFLLAADAAKDDEATKKDAEKMQGDWQARSMIQDGIKFPDDDAQAFFRTVKSDEYTLFRFDQEVAKWKFKLDAAKTPKAIDVFKPDDDKKPAVLGTYEIDGDKFKLCVAAPGKDRPTEFTSKEGSGQTLTTWEREKKK
jgi:uncharacterized protein (TIGR03067 family)